MVAPNASSDPLGGSVLVDRVIREAVARGDIRIVAPKKQELERVGEAKFPFGDLDHYESAVHASNRLGDEPMDCVESTGYKLLPLRYYDRKRGKWRLIPPGPKGFVLKPGREVAIEPQQYVGFSENYCALHLARFSGQISGASIATGLIQPEWGATREAPVFITVRNISRTKINITRDEAISRLVFFRVSGDVMERGRGTSLASIKARIERDQATLSRRIMKTKWSRRAWYGSLMVFLASALYWLPLVLPLARIDTQINEYAGTAIVAVVAFLFAQLVQAERRDDDH